jgi:FixJ family two-component response regulator
MVSGAVFVIDDDPFMRAALEGLIKSVGLHLRLFTRAKRACDPCCVSR